MQFKPDVKGIRALPAAHGLDAVVAMSPENFIYVSGAYICTVKDIRSRHGYAVIPAAGEPFNVVCSIEESLTREESWIPDVRTYTEFVDVPVRALARELGRQGLDKGRIGIDLDYLPASAFAELHAALPNVSFVNTTQAVAALRAVKSESEIAIIEFAEKQTHGAALAALADSRLGDSEQQIAQRIANNVINSGAQGTLFLDFGSGKRTAHAHAIASPDVVPQPGDLIRFDVGGAYGAFSSDFARTCSAGDPTEEQKQVYAALVTIQAEVIAAVAPGIAAEDLYYLCRDLFAAHGLPFSTPHIGHSFGVELHEQPMLRPNETTKLTPGMVLAVEPLVKHGSGTYHTEDLALVTADGSRLLSLGLAPMHLPVLGERVSY